MFCDVAFHTLRYTAISVPQLSAVSLTAGKDSNKRTRIKGSTSAYALQLAVRTERPIHYFGERQTILETPAGGACGYGAAAHGLMPGSKGIAGLVHARALHPYQQLTRQISIWTNSASLYCSKPHCLFVSAASLSADRSFCTRQSIS